MSSRCRAVREEAELRIAVGAEVVHRVDRRHQLLARGDDLARLLAVAFDAEVVASPPTPTRSRRPVACRRPSASSCRRPASRRSGRPGARAAPRCGGRPSRRPWRRSRTCGDPPRCGARPAPRSRRAAPATPFMRANGREVAADAGVDVEPQTRARARAPRAPRSGRSRRTGSTAPSRPASACGR